MCAIVVDEYYVLVFTRERKVGHKSRHRWGHLHHQDDRHLLDIAHSKTVKFRKIGRADMFLDFRGGVLGGRPISSGTEGQRTFFVIARRKFLESREAVIT